MDPKPEEFARRLTPLTKLLYSLLDSATHDAKAFFEADGKTFSTSLFPGLVRYATKLRWDALLAAPHDVGEFLGFVRVDVLNDGLAFRNSSHQIRVWKSDEGGLPTPGRSESKRLFYAQGSLFEGEWNQLAISDVDPEWTSSAPSNLALLWEVDENHLLSSLELVCPEVGLDGKFGETWRVSIPHPAETTSVEASTTPSDFELNLNLELHRDDGELPDGEAEGGEDVG